MCIRPQYALLVCRLITDWLPDSVWERPQFSVLVDRLISWLTDWFHISTPSACRTGWSTDLRTDWLIPSRRVRHQCTVRVDWLSYWLISSWFVVSVPYWLINWFLDLFIPSGYVRPECVYWLIGWFTDWLTDCILVSPQCVNRLICWLTHSIWIRPYGAILADRLIYGLTDWFHLVTFLVYRTGWLINVLIDWFMDWLTDFIWSRP